MANELLTNARIGDFAEFHIDPVELNDLVETHGIGVEWRQAVWCPCARIETRKSRANCPICRGLGHVYPTDLHDDLVCLVLNRNPKRDRVPAGELVTGTCVITFPLGIVPGQGDLIFPCDEVHVVHENLWRASQQIDNTAVRQRAARVSADVPHVRPPKKQVPPAEKLIYPSIIQFDHLYWIDRKTKKLLKGTIGADFKLGPTNEIKWIKGRGPPAGEGYSVRYLAEAAYIISPGEPLYRRENDGVGYPYRVEGQRLDQWAEISLRTNVVEAT